MTATTELDKLLGVVSRSGEHALEGSAVGRPAMRCKHELDRQLEQRVQP